MDWMDCCSTSSTIGEHRAGGSRAGWAYSSSRASIVVKEWNTVEPVLQQSIQSILSASAGLSASAAILFLGRWIYHKSTGPIGEIPPGAGAPSADLPAASFS